MSRPTRHRRRRRPGRRPPYRYRARQPARGTRSARPRGYSAPGLRQLYELLVPLRGRARRLSLNLASSATTVAAALAAGLAGYGLAGPLGALLAFGVGLSACGRYVERNRYFRG